MLASFSSGLSPVLWPEFWNQQYESNMKAMHVFDFTWHHRALVWDIFDRDKPSFEPWGWNPVLATSNVFDLPNYDYCVQASLFWWMVVNAFDVV